MTLMSFEKELKEILEDIYVLLENELKSRSSITVSPEFIKRWKSFNPQDFANRIKQVSIDVSEEEIKKTVDFPESEIKKGKNSISETISEIQKQLDIIRQEVAQCTKCPISEDRTNTVFGTGNPEADLVFVGEAPGAEEDRQGLPFVGRAGQLLTDIIVKGMKMRREDVYICNVLKCRPPNNRDPNPMEVMNCEPYLLRQLELIKPKVICALGRISAQTLLKTDAPLNELRGKWHNYHGIPLRVTYHPAYLLRNPADKKKAWIDIQEVMKLLNGEITVTFEDDNRTLL